MKKLYSDAVDVSQGVANRAVRIVEKHLRQAQVERAKDLSEEARVRLYRELRVFFETETGGGEHLSEGRRESLWAKFLKKMEDFLSFSESAPTRYVQLSFCGSTAYCENGKSPIIAITRRAEGLGRQEDSCGEG